MNINELVITQYLPNYKDYMIFSLSEFCNAKPWRLIILSSNNGADVYCNVILRDLHYDEVVCFSLKYDISIEKHVETENQR